MRTTTVTDSSAGKISILVLISDKVMRTVVGEALEANGYEVLEAAGLGAAVDWINRCRPDLLLIRPDIGSMSGHDAAKYLRTRCPGLAVLMVGGLADDDRLVNREALEEFEVFPTPFPMSDLLRLTKTLVNRVHPAVPR